jgi:hypothetical protein
MTFSKPALLLLSLTLACSSLNASFASTDSEQFLNAFVSEPAEVEGGPDLDFCHTEKWSAACLTGLLIYRCDQYTIPFAPLGCALASLAFMDNLQLKRIDVVIENETYNLPVIFTEHLERLIQDPKTQAMIGRLRAELVSAASNQTPFDLWKWMLAAQNGNREKAIENLAVLLQDTSGVVLHIEYLKSISKDRGYKPATLRAINDLDEVNYQLNYQVLKANNYKKWLKLYPDTKNIESEMTPLVYHFYPMAFLAQRLKKARHGDRLSAFLPFLFNTEYLSQTLDPEMWPLKHPRPFKIDNDWKRWNMRDNYDGLAGSLFGIGKSNNLKGLDAYQNAYSKNPYGTMRRYFWTLPTL